MKNAHERFGFAEFEKKLRDTTTRIRLTADCFIGERAERGAPSVGHLLRYSVPMLRLRLYGRQSLERNRYGSAARTSNRTWSSLASAPWYIGGR
jgi:hypothetical protein